MRRRRRWPDRAAPYRVGRRNDHEGVTQPKDFFQPSPGALRHFVEIPIRPRMIHFFPPHLEKVTASPARPEVDVPSATSGAIPADSGGRTRFVKVAKEMDFGETQL